MKIEPKHAYVVTATGTDIGKTFVTSLLVRYFRDCAIRVAACKPVMSGVGQDISYNDAAVLLAALGEEVNVSNSRRISPWQFSAPLSPHRAAALENKEIVPEALLAWCHKWLVQYADSIRFIEGVGGVMVPFHTPFTMLDFMKRLRLPVVLVTGDYLGTLSHTLTAVSCLQSKSIDIKGIIVNQSVASVDHMETVNTLKQFTQSNTPVISLPRWNGLQSGNYAFKQMLIHPDYQDFFLFAQSLCYDCIHEQSK